MGKSPHSYAKKKKEEEGGGGGGGGGGEEVGSLTLVGIQVTKKD